MFGRQIVRMVFVFCLLFNPFMNVLQTTFQLQKLYIFTIKCLVIILLYVVIFFLFLISLMSL